MASDVLIVLEVLTMLTGLVSTRERFTNNHVPVFKRSEPTSSMYSLPSFAVVRAAPERQSDARHIRQVECIGSLLELCKRSLAL